jgi:hypothetical protein
MILNRILRTATGDPAWIDLIFVYLLIPHPGALAGRGRKRLIFIQRRANAPCGPLGERRELTKGDIHTASTGPGCRSTWELHTQKGEG